MIIHRQVGTYVSNIKPVNNIPIGTIFYLNKKNEIINNFLQVNSIIKQVQAKKTITFQISNIKTNVARASHSFTTGRPSCEIVSIHSIVRRYLGQIQSLIKYGERYRSSNIKYITDCIIDKVGKRAQAQAIANSNNSATVAMLIAIRYSLHNFVTNTDHYKYSIKMLRVKEIKLVSLKITSNRYLSCQVGVQFLFEFQVFVLYCCFRTVDILYYVMLRAIILHMFTVLGA